MSRRMLITAGPTHEPIDHIRYIANRSSGKMGIEVARAANELGWSVTLLLGPTALEPPSNIDVHPFESYSDLQALLEHHFEECDVLVMVAAVADFRASSITSGKMERSTAETTLKLVPTPDLVAACCARKRAGQFVVGFALEPSERLESRAREKLLRKDLDAIVANPLETIGSRRIQAKIITRSGETIRPDTKDAFGKALFARFLVNWIGETTGARQ